MLNTKNDAKNSECCSLTVDERHFFATGTHCELLVSPAGPSDVKVLAGRNVTLAVSFSGASDPVVTWLIRERPVVTWTIASSEPPDIAEERRTVLQVESNG